MHTELILSTRNAHKAEEFTRMLAPYGLSVVPLPAEVVLPPEDGDTFEANAKDKAIAAAVALGVPVIADDSGIEAEALGGRPGVYSARFAGENATDEENLAKLLAQAPAGSGVRYVCALVFALPDSGGGPHKAFTYVPGTPGGGVGYRALETFLGECRGKLAPAPAGSGGFGYDPAFIPDEYADGRTMAQLTPQEKDRISHRGRAVQAFGEWYAAGGTLPRLGRAAPLPGARPGS